MQSERDPDPPPKPDERDSDEARLTIERAEEAWQRQLDGEDAAAREPGNSVLRIALLVAAAAAIVFLLFQRLAQLG